MLSASPQPRRRLKHRPLGVTVLAYVCLVAQLSAFAHRVLVQHATCAEHGESIHVALAAPTSNALHVRRQVAPGADSAALDARVSVARVTVTDDHDHCSVILSRGLASLVHAPTAMGGTSDGAPLRDVRSLAIGPGAATYRLAPKTSPPAATHA